jgi:putative NADPH-quinone reductase
MQQTATLCQMTYLTPFVLYDVLSSDILAQIEAHANAYEALLIALRDDTFDAANAAKLEYFEAKDVAKLGKG